MPKVGRPLKFKTVEEMQEKIDAFFRDEDPIGWTVTGLALAIDTTRDLLYNYEDFGEFNNAIKIAKAKIRHEAEKRLHKRGNAGDIFMLKNYGYRDKQELDTKISGNINLTDLANLAKIAQKEDEEDDKD